VIDKKYISKELPFDKIDNIISIFDTYNILLSHDDTELFWKDVQDILSEFYSFDSDFFSDISEFIHKFKITYDLWYDLADVFEIPVSEYKEFRGLNKPVALNAKHREYIEWYNELILSVVDTDISTVDSSKFKRSLGFYGRRSKIHNMLISTDYRSAEDIVRIAVGNNWSLNTVYQALNEYCRGDYLLSGFFIKVKDKKMRLVRSWI